MGCRFHDLVARSPLATASYEYVNDQVVDPGMNRTLGRLLGSLGRLSCTGNDPLDSSCHLMGCMRSYTTLITVTHRTGQTDLPFPFQGQYGGAYSGATIAFITWANDAQRMGAHATTNASTVGRWHGAAARTAAG